ncbi:peptidoglycan-binding domain-containing protein [Phaeovulum vinaykumarii]|uniref:Putative peptidoglycan binding domain-containing protein n=1 Tax=Phaeovulum vinaykumarii TaxID=407234 RepID=A0A1N7JKV9_9RHOB|nr:peptidoglycan-binding domain-containing protein [Phaeovulum vinaykumarii]SIS49881.1 Putative peptidoglycan binding domain-containing protein [Phaeovulum vinaykumarii]SOB89973.1 putative peptidoglycan binding protein [Phaeovulum vinaykumarii]
MTGLALASLALPVAAQGTRPVAPNAAIAPLTSLADVARPRAPAEGTPGCWAEDTLPAHIETVTEQVQITPETRDPKTGTITAPARWRTETHQRIVSERTRMWFEVPCAEDMTPETLTLLQRALAVRGLLAGAPTGTMDAATARAVRLYQRPRGLDSAVLSLRAARELGVLPWGPADSAD